MPQSQSDQSDPGIVFELGVGNFRCKAIRVVKEDEEVPLDRIASHRPIDIVSAIIRRGLRFLVAQRKRDDRFGGMWEFPGGKVEEGEELDAALRRELREEVGIESVIGEKLQSNLFRFPDVDLHVHFFRAEIVGDREPWPADADAVRWVTMEEILKAEPSGADRVILNLLTPA